MPTLTKVFKYRVTQPDGQFADALLTIRNEPDPPSDAVLLDKFTESNPLGVNLVDHAPDIGGPWVLDDNYFPPSIRIYDNVLRRPTDNENPYAHGTVEFYNDTVLPDSFVLTYKLILNDTNYATLAIGKEGYPDVGDNMLVSIEAQDGTAWINFANGSSYQLTYTAGTVLRIRHVMNNDTGEAETFVNGVSVKVDPVGPDWWTGKLGFSMYDFGGLGVMRLDNVTAYPRPAPVFGTGDFYLKTTAATMDHFAAYTAHSADVQELGGGFDTTQRTNRSRFPTLNDVIVGNWRSGQFVGKPSRGSFIGDTPMLAGGIYAYEVKVNAPVGELGVDHDEIYVGYCYPTFLGEGSGGSNYDPNTALSGELVVIAGGAGTSRKIPDPELTYAEYAPINPGSTVGDVVGVVVNTNTSMAHFFVNGQHQFSASIPSVDGFAYVSASGAFSAL